MVADVDVAGDVDVAVRCTVLHWFLSVFEAPGYVKKHLCCREVVRIADCRGMNGAALSLLRYFN